LNILLDQSFNDVSCWNTDRGRPQTTMLGVGVLHSSRHEPKDVRTSHAAGNGSIRPATQPKHIYSGEGRPPCLPGHVLASTLGLHRVIYIRPNRHDASISMVSGVGSF